MGSGVQIDQSLIHEAGQRLGQQAIEQVGMLGAEIREHVVIEGHAAAQPLVGAVALTEAFDLAGTGDAIDGRPEQQGKEDAKVRGIAAHMALDGLDGLEEFGQIDGFDEGPDEAGEMIGIEALVERFGAKLSLEAFRPVDARCRPGFVVGRGGRRRRGRHGGHVGLGKQEGLGNGRGRGGRWLPVTGCGRLGDRQRWGVYHRTPSGVLEGKDIHPPKLALSLPSGQLSVKKSQPLRVMIVVQAARLLLYRRAACTTKKSQPLRVSRSRRVGRRPTIPRQAWWAFGPPYASGHWRIIT